jgi:hypothetical protein
LCHALHRFRSSEARTTRARSIRFSGPFQSAAFAISRSRSAVSRITIPFEPISPCQDSNMLVSANYVGIRQLCWYSQFCWYQPAMLVSTNYVGISQPVNP